MGARSDARRAAWIQEHGALCAARSDMGAHGGFCAGIAGRHLLLGRDQADA